MKKATKLKSVMLNYYETAPIETIMAELAKIQDELGGTGMYERFLFRGKRLNSDKWIQGYVLKCDNGEFFIVKNIKAVNYHDMDFDGAEVDPATLGQCTGLRDKNGTLIFEGDIVSYEGKNRSIQYMPKYAAYALSKIEYGLVLAWEYVDRMEIIGSIHTTPELMEGKDGTKID